MTCCYTLQATGEGRPGSNLPKRTLRTNHWSLSRARSPCEPLARLDRQPAQSRCHSCNFQIVKEQPGERADHSPRSHTTGLPTRRERIRQFDSPRMDRGRQGIRPGYLTSLWPLSRGDTPGERIAPSEETENISAQREPVKRCPNKILRAG